MKSKILVVALVLFFGLIFTSSGFADFYIVKNEVGEIVAIQNQNIFKNEYQELGYTFELWFKTTKETLTFDSVVKRIESQLTETQGSITETQGSITETQGSIKVLDWTSYLDGNYYYVEGILKNVSKAKVEYVQVKVIAYDSSKKLVTLKESYANPYDLAPGQEATFKVMVKHNSRIDTFGLRVNWK